MKFARQTRGTVMARRLCEMATMCQVSGRVIRVQSVSGVPAWHGKTAHAIAKVLLAVAW